MLVIAYSIYDILLYPTCASTVYLSSTAFYTLGYWSNWIGAFGPHPAAPQLCSFYAVWSLAIEEQFYLVWPPLLVGLLRWRVSFRSVSTLLCTLLALTVAIRILLGTFGASYWRTYAGTDTHADPLLIGCLLATGIFSTPRVFWEKRMYLLRFCGPLALVGLVILMVRIPFPSSHFFTVQFTVVGLLTALVILSVTVTNAAPMTKVFAWAPLVWLGKLSYSIYLWHSSADFYLRAHFPLVPVGGRIAIGLALALVSYHYIERPFLRMKNKVANGEQYIPPTTRSVTFDSLKSGM
jgi:peptidoglycan/LPS O-acetylase OafA/YrhL